ncbi:tetratricopeptide repeat protein [Humisphaera borealis]|uniref:Tetratricopeptide repeat protein n=1 Tax=Humisphaera borealis TaxID=2807512 RepID=A0A7M2X1M6_9BACT|nr:tetratricopeptide repeat protein [Humisphaera borealis]QOV91656.1 tetratricopeptide repeat protein [Humisphaera borealis]
MTDESSGDRCDRTDVVVGRRAETRAAGSATQSGRPPTSLARSLLLSAALFAAPAVCIPQLASTASAQQQLAPEEQAALLLNAARRAYNDRNYPQAANQFREYTAKFGGMKDVNAAWYGLGLSLLDGPRDYAGSADALSRVVADAAAPDRPFAAYFRGTALRSLGLASQRLAVEKPPEAPTHIAAAKAKLDEAASQFAEAVKAFEALLKSAPPDRQPMVIEWIARSRCDWAESLLRTGKPKESLAAADPVITDAVLGKSKYRPLALYQAGQANVALKETVAAGRALSQLAPFDQEFGDHVRYLLGRIHHESGERPEAMTQYKAVIAAVDQQRKSAQQQLQQGGNNLPADRRAYLEQVAAGPLPDHLPRSMFYLGVLLADEGKFPEAREQFGKVATDFKAHPLAAEALLRVGYCQLQSKQNAEAIATLTPLKDHATLGDQSTWWLAKAQLAAADANNPQAVDAAAKQSIVLMTAAAAKAQQLAATDTNAKGRRSDILMDLADAQIAAKAFTEAAGTYRAVITENAVPERAEEAHQRVCTALHLAGAFDESDTSCDNFEKKYPKSTLLPAVWFRSAENAYLKAVAADAKPEVPRPEVERLFNNAVIRYQKLIEKYPEFQHVHLARQGMALSQLKLAKPTQAIAILTQIPESDRNGELATVGYLQADALLRTFPPETDDAIQAAGLIQQAEQAAKMLENFAGSNAKHALAPDAILKMGYCYQRMAGLLAEKPERDKAMQLAREAYEKHLREFAGHPTAPAVVFERAKLIAMQGDVGGAMNELRRFSGDPLRTSPNAPLALLRLATLMRSQGQAKEAADLLAKVRAEHEANLAKDPARASWASMLAYEQALATKQAIAVTPTALADARKLFDEIVAKYAGKPEAINAIWRSAQCRREEIAKIVETATRKLNSPQSTKDEQTAAIKALDDAGTALSEAAKPVAAMADQLGEKGAGTDGHLQLLYELAWCDRVAATAETESVRQKRRREQLAKIVEKLPKGSQPPVLIAPDVPLSSIPPTPSSKRARERYEKVIAAGTDKPIAVTARFELAELLADRGEDDGALDLLNAALLNSPNQDLSERIRLRMAACLLAKNDAKAATAALKDLSRPAKADQPNVWSQVRGEAQFLLAEASVQSKDWPKAIELLVPFRDQEPLRNLAGVSDRAMLRLGQAYASAGQWDPSRQAFEALIQRYPTSGWTEEARFGVGYSFQKQGRFDEAANSYAEVTRRTAAEVAARSQVHIGLCRIEQKKFAEATTALLSVPYTYDYPDWSAAACYEAARAFKEMQKPAESNTLLKRVVTEYPDTPSAALAKAMLQSGT